MDFDLTHEQRQILEYGDTIAQRFDRKYWMDCAEKRVFPEALYRQVAADGFVGTMVPEEYGGAGQGMVEMHLFLEGLSNNGIPLLNLVVGAAMSLGFIAKYGSETQRGATCPMRAGETSASASPSPRLMRAPTPCALRRSQSGAATVSR